MRNLIIVISILFITLPLSAQSIYQDVLRLEKYVQQTGVDMKMDVYRGDSTYVSILKKYIPEEKRDSINTNTDFHWHFRKNGNRFLSAYFDSSGTTSNIDTPVIAAEEKKLSKAVGGLNVSTIADGIAKFLVERANEELSIAFFSRFKKEIKKNVELTTLFPTSTRLIERLDPLQYSYMLNALKEAFRDDISKLVVNIEDLVETKKYRELIASNEDLKFIYLAIEASQIVYKLSKGSHPADVIDGLGKHKKVEKVSTNLANGLKVVSLLSSSIRDSADGSAYVSAGELKENIFNNTVSRDLFLGLLYQRSLGITFDKKEEKGILSFAKVIKKVEGKVGQFETVYTNLITHYEVVQKHFKEVGEIPVTDRRYLDYYELFVTLPNFIDSGFDEIERLFESDSTQIKDYRDKVDRYLMVAREGGDIMKNVRSKNYASAIVNLVEIYDYAIGIKVDAINKSMKELMDSYQRCVDKIDKCEGEANYKGVKERIVSLLQVETQHFDGITFRDLTDSKKSRKEFRKKVITYFEDNVFIDKQMDTKLMKYGIFMANVAKAENSDQVQAAIKAAALPAGSSRIKRVSKWNLSVNAYLGGFGGGERLRENNDLSGTVGVFVPIGIALSRGWGYGNETRKSVNSISLFINAIDLGALASYRIKDKAKQLPEFTLENIIAPGAYLAWNVGGTPLTVMGGAQLGPQLRKIDTGSPTLTKSSAWRWQVAVTVDIPLFNLGTATWN
ncbi:hypothetical protein [Fodinibius saliphilus]|uniref:hypothetical protein n=1 Tax=Fodinibius saliphilus TaxID=1920650 RepID=UPI001108A0C6|nr:hypothetical protein [Fodinibius saliphilus]